MPQPISSSWGHYAIAPDGSLQTHPGDGNVGTPSAGAHPTVHYIAAQRANVAVVLTNIRDLACELKEYGWMLHGPQFQGRLFDSDGRELDDSGTLDAQWVFLATDEYVAGVRRGCPM